MALPKVCRRYGLGFIVSCLVSSIALSITQVILDAQDVLSLPTPHIHGYDLSYQGVQGIWEGLKPSNTASANPHPVVDDTPIAHQRSLLDAPPPGAPHHARASSSGNSTSHHSQRNHSPADDFHGDWSSALSVLASRRGVNRASWKPLVKTDKLIERQIALEVCGWNLREEEVARSIKRLALCQTPKLKLVLILLLFS